MTELRTFKLTRTQIKTLLATAHRAVAPGNAILFCADPEKIMSLTKMDLNKLWHEGWTHRECRFFDGRSIRKLEEAGLVESGTYERRGIQRKTWNKVVESFPQARITDLGFLVAQVIANKLLKRNAGDGETRINDLLWDDESEYSDFEIKSCTITLKI